MDISFNKKARLDACNEALEQYNNFQVSCKRHDVIAVMNMHEPSYRERLYVVDVASNEVLHNLHAAHGVNSSMESDRAYADKFSNIPESRQSCIGALVTGDIYNGKHGMSLRLRGLQACNSNAEQRCIVLHDAKYMKESYIQRMGRAGQSFGCPAISPDVSSTIINLLQGGVFFYIYY